MLHLQGETLRSPGTLTPPPPLVDVAGDAGASLVPQVALSDK